MKDVQRAGLVVHNNETGVDQIVRNTVDLG